MNEYMEPSYTFQTASDRDFPPLVQLTINNVCQLDCHHCPQQEYAKSKYNDGSRMSLNLFRKIVEQMKGHSHSALRIVSRGEPLLHPDIVEMVKIAKVEARLPTVSVITNGILLKGNIAEGFIRNGLDLVEVSLDAFTEEAYREVRPLNGREARKRKSPFEAIVTNILRYVQLRDERNPSCKIVVSIIDQPHVKHEVEDFIASWQQRVDRVLRRTLHSFQGRVSGIPMPERRHPCRILWARFNIHSNGNVPICYNDWKNEETLGNINDPTTTIADLWHHPTYEAYRTSHLQNVYPGICASCRDWTGPSWKNPYESLFVNVSPATGTAPEPAAIPAESRR
ncbi:MAG: radical SAM protein [Acidobacteriota bacterium]|nr:radical SAM protein [Acidobacteriota bacterium]